MRGGSVETCRGAGRKGSRKRGKETNQQITVNIYRYAKEGRQGSREAGRQGGRVTGRQGGREAKGGEGRRGGEELGRHGGKEVAEEAAPSNIGGHPGLDAA